MSFVTSEFCLVDTAHAQRLNCVMLTQLKRVIHNKLRLSIHSFFVMLELCLADTAQAQRVSYVLLAQLKRQITFVYQII